MDFTNTYTQVKNNIITRKKYKIISFLDKKMDLFYFNTNNQKVKLNDNLTEEELDALVDELNQNEITCVCEDLSSMEENC